MRQYLQGIGLLIFSALMLWAMHHFLGAPPCQDAPLFTIKGTNLDCAMKP